MEAIKRVEGGTDCKDCISGNAAQGDLFSHPTHTKDGGQTVIRVNEILMRWRQLHDTES